MATFIGGGRYAEEPTPMEWTPTLILKEEQEEATFIGGGQLRYAEKPLPEYDWAAILALASKSAPSNRPKLCLAGITPSCPFGTDTSMEPRFGPGYACYVDQCSDEEGSSYDTTHYVDISKVPKEEYDVAYECVKEAIDHYNKDNKKHIELERLVKFHKRVAIKFLEQFKFSLTFEAKNGDGVLDIFHAEVLWGPSHEREGWTTHVRFCRDKGDTDLYYSIFAPQGPNAIVMVANCGCSLAGPCLCGRGV